MSGFALVFDTQCPVSSQDQDFVALKSHVADYKQLDLARSCETSGRQCVAVKFDTRSTLHRGVTIDEQTGSWMLAVGTVLNGENNPDDGNLRDVLTGYLKRGNAVFEDLDGHFALVVYDKLADKLLVVSDPLGMMPVFCGRRGNRAYVSTSALAVAQAVQATPSKYGVYFFLSVGEIYGTHTLWQEVRRLSGGVILEMTPAGSAESVYWSFTVNDEITRLSLADTADYALALLSKVVKQGLEREGRVWADLTGGFDSRLVTMLMDRVELPFKACCGGPKRSLDVIISSRIAQGLGWAYEHNILPEDWGKIRCGWLPRAIGKTDGHLDVLKSSSVLWDQEQRAREHNVSIWGLGGEIWRGTYWNFELLNAGRTPKVNYGRLVDFKYITSVNRTVFADVGQLAWIREELKTLLRSVGDRYAGFPNTVQLDAVSLFDEVAHTGTQMGAVIGQQRAIAPLDFKEGMVGAFSIRYKWRIHSRLVRLLLDKANPVLASFETEIGGPASPMRVTNLYKFLPYWSLLAKQLVRKASRKYLGRNLLPGPRRVPSPYPLDYPSLQWRCETLDCLEQEDLLSHGHMHSGALYGAEGLASFLKQARTEEFRQEGFLSRIVTVEMALRAVGTSF